MTLVDVDFIAFAFAYHGGAHVQTGLPVVVIDECRGTAIDQSRGDHGRTQVVAGAASAELHLIL